MNLEEFIARWAASGDAERANKDTFLVELCDVLEVPRPEPKTGDPARDGYVFEARLVVEAGARQCLYKSNTMSAL